LASELASELGLAVELAVELVVELAESWGTICQSSWCTGFRWRHTTDHRGSSSRHKMILPSSNLWTRQGWVKGMEMVLGMGPGMGLERN